MLGLALELIGIGVGLFATWLTWKGIVEARAMRERLRLGIAEEHHRPHRDLDASNIFIAHATRPPVENIQLVDSDLRIVKEARPKISQRPIGPRRRSITDELTDLLVRQLDALVLDTKPKPPRTDLPDWTMAILGSEDAERYRKEFGAHLHELIQDGELDQARRDRRRMIRAALWLAIAIRAHRALTRTR